MRDSKIDAFRLPTWEARGGEYVRRLMSEFGLADFQAAGLVGNLGFESSGFERLREIGQPEGRGGYGVAQWTASRRRLFLAWCVDRKLDWQSDEANYGFLLNELHGSHRSTITALRKTRDLGAAVFSVGQTYERPGGTTATHLPGYEGRLSYALRALVGAGAPGPAPVAEVISPFDRIKAIQVVLGVKPDGDMGKNSWAAMNALLEAAGQAGVEC